MYVGDGRDFKKNYFRLALINILQRNVFGHSQIAIFDTFSQEAKTIVLHDVGRALAWTEMLARETLVLDNKVAKLDNEEPSPSTLPDRVFERYEQRLKDKLERCEKAIRNGSKS
jgi:hypothetical protein